MSPDPQRPAPDGAVVDARNPWPGLTAFSEDLRSYFHGRAEEIEELERRVRRRPLTVLYGQSGLGKTSLLQAGLFPRLRAEGFLPVPIRIDHSEGRAEAGEQIRLALADAFSAAGVDTGGLFARSGSAWECLHRLEFEPRNAAGELVVPVLVLDQFEELFTLGAGASGSDFARSLVDEIGALVENRPPRALDQRFEATPALVEQFDFERQGYRVLLSLREDYLPHLYDLRASIPSIAQNSMRLTRMNGEQALEAVLRPAGSLVTPPVAQAIVRFVAGAREPQGGARVSATGSDFRELEVEPALLSLFCRELNHKRRERGDAEVSLDLVRGSREEILREFYESCFRDQPPAVRAFVEEELLTESGYRESMARERAEARLERRGAPRGALDTLVHRRLLQVEERLRVQRVELTHDVLADVARQSRAGRRQEEALAEAERNAAAATLQARRARRRAIVVVAGALGIGGMLALFGLEAIRQGRAARAATAAAIAAESLAVRRASDVSQLNAQLSANAEVLSSQRDELGRQAETLQSLLRRQATLREAAEASAVEARRMGVAATERLEQICSYGLALASALSSEVASQQLPDADDGGTAAQAASEVFQDYLTTTVRHFDSLYARDPSAACVRQMRARVRIAAASDADDRNQRSARLRWSRDALPAVRSLRELSDSVSQHLAQRLYTDLVYYLWIGGDQPRADSAAVEGIAVSERLDPGRSRSTLYLHARLHQLLANVRIQRDRRDDARAHFQESLRLLDQGLRRSDQDSSGLLLGLSQVRLGLGQLDSTAGRSGEARANYVAAAAAARVRARRLHTQYTVEWLGRVLRLQGDLELRLGIGDRGRAAFAAAVEALGDSVITRESQSVLDNRSRAHRALGTMALIDGDTTGALRHLGAQLRADSGLAGRAASPDAARLGGMASTLETVGRLRQARGAHREAVAAREQLVSIRRAMRDTTAQSRANLAVALGNLAWSRVNLRQGAAAVANAVEGLGVDSSQTYIYTNLAHALLQSGRLAEAAAVYQGCSQVRYGGRLFADVVREDLADLAAAGALRADEIRQVGDWLARPQGACAVPPGVGPPG